MVTDKYFRSGSTPPVSDHYLHFEGFRPGSHVLKTTVFFTSLREMMTYSLICHLFHIFQLTLTAKSWVCLNEISQNRHHCAVHLPKN